MAFRIICALHNIASGNFLADGQQRVKHKNLRQAPMPEVSSSGNYRDAIASIESDGSGGYSAIGPSHPKMGRALGRYQVMESNIGPWSREALGREVSADEFMANPQLQDKIFDHKFGGYVSQFGPEGAAQAWFGGPGGVGKLDRKDSLGTTIGAYTDKFRKAAGGTQPPQTGHEAIESIAPINGSAPPQITQQNFNDRFGGSGAHGGLADLVMKHNIPISAQQPPSAGRVQLANAITQRAAQPGAPSVQQLLGVMSSPDYSYMSDGQKQLVNVMLEQGMKRQQAEQQRVAQQNDPAYQLDLQYRQAQIDALRRKGSGEEEESFFGNPMAVQNPDGSMSYGQIGNKGTFRPIQLGEGQSFAPPTKTIDGGTENLIMDQAGNVVARVPKNVVQVAEQTAGGKNLAEAKAALPQIQASANEIVSTIESLEKDPYLNNMVGSVQGRLPTFTSDGARVQSKMDQIGGQAFMQAFNSLRGGGQITEQEGAKATAAMARLNTAQSEKDYREALAELRGVVERAVANVRTRAGGEQTPPGVPSAPASNEVMDFGDYFK